MTSRKKKKYIKNVALPKTKNHQVAENQDNSPRPKEVQEVQVVQEAYSGPLPHPAILQQYNKIVPGAAERILEMAEQNAKHRRNLQFAALKAQKSEIRIGQLFGFGIGISALSTSIVAMYFGFPAVAGIIGGTTVVGLVTVFVIGRSSSRSSPNNMDSSQAE